MDISTKRFNVKQEHGIVTVRDRTAPYHLHSIPASKVPSVHHLAQITESQFNRLISKLIYG